MPIEKVMFLDYETYSSVDIKNGVYVYTESPDFELRLRLRQKDSPLFLRAIVRPLSTRFLKCWRANHD